MNYIKMFANGLKYVDAACSNWDRRKRKLISAWCRSEADYKKKTPKKQRINKLIDVLDERINTLSKARFIFLENQKRQREEAERGIIFLECTNFECRYSPGAAATGVGLKGYEPGKYKCDKCGAELMTEADRDIDLMLFNLGICPL